MLGLLPFEDGVELSCTNVDERLAIDSEHFWMAKRLPLYICPTLCDSRDILNFPCLSVDGVRMDPMDALSAAGDPASAAGPSRSPATTKKRRKRDRANGTNDSHRPASKTARIVSPHDSDPMPSQGDVEDPMDRSGGEGVDPMDLLAADGAEPVHIPDDPMAALERHHANAAKDDDNGDEDDRPGGEVQPVRADEFEQEAEREVEASKGLDGGVDEGKMKLVHQVRHQVALPPTYPYIPIAQHKRLDPPARTYKFQLDPFQEVATSCIERNESVLVSAHTSAGKTVVAEYAIATCLKEGRRVVYTSPIKVSGGAIRERLMIRHCQIKSIESSARSSRMSA